MSAAPPISTPRDGLSSLARLQGVWRLQREIRHDSGQVDRLSGQCTFSRSGPRWIQEESGHLKTNEGTFEATRRYIWTETDGWLHVHFADMRPFLSIPTHVARPQATHLCPPDRYEAVFDFGRWPEWETVWTVEGPRKAYVMTSLFSPDA